MNNDKQTLLRPVNKHSRSATQAVAKNTSNRKASLVIPAVMAGFIFATAANMSIAEAAGTTVKSPDQVEQALTALLDTRKNNVDSALVAQVPTTYNAQTAATSKQSEKPDHSEKSVSELILAGLAITNEAKNELASKDPAPVDEPVAKPSSDFQVKDIKTESELAALEQEVAKENVVAAAEAEAIEAEVTKVAAVVEVEAVVESTEEAVVAEVEAVEIEETEVAAVAEVEAVVEPTEEAVVTAAETDAIETEVTEVAAVAEVEAVVESSEEVAIAVAETAEVAAAAEVETVEESTEEAVVAALEEGSELTKEVDVAKAEAATASADTKVASAPKVAEKKELPALPKVATSSEMPALPAIAKAEKAVAPEPTMSKPASQAVVNDKRDDTASSNPSNTDDNYSMIAISESAEDANVEELSANSAELYAASESSETAKVQDTNVIDELEANVEVAVRAAGCPESFNQVDIPVNGKLCQIFAADYPASMILFIPQTPEEVVAYYLSSSVEFAEPKTIKQRTMIKSADNNTTLIISKDGGGTQVDILVKAPLS